MENLCSIYRFIVLSPVPCLSRSIKRPGLPRMGLVTNGTRFSQRKFPIEKFPNFFVNGKRPKYFFQHLSEAKVLNVIRAF